VGCAHEESSPLAINGPKPTTQPAPLPHNFERWEKEIAAYEAADRANPPAKGGILFIGSSTIRMWTTLQSDFPEHKVINRGFGGSEIADATHFADRIIFPYEPQQVFLRSGGNDIHNGRLPTEVAGDFETFVQTVHARLPKAEIIFIGQSPAPSRWGEWDKNRLLNSMVRRMALRRPRVTYIDTWDMTLTPDHAKARRELFIADQLHFNAEGYKLLAERVRPYLPVIVAK
jgi:lysophospholipase L1-like esterase